MIPQRAGKPFHISDILNVRLRPVRVSTSSPLRSQTADSMIVQENQVTKPKKAFCISDILSVKLRPVGLKMVTRSSLGKGTRGASSEKGGLLDSSSKLFSTKRTPSSKSKAAATQKSMHSALKQALHGRFSRAMPNHSMHIDTEPNSPMSDW